MTKIFDCFTFFDEYDILKLRLEELNNIVDYFVLCEASETFVGDKKELNFLQNKEKYSEYLHKIIYVRVDDFPSQNDVWVREEHQRECLLRGLDMASGEDLIVISDVDEIPRATELEKIKDFNGYIRFNMDMFQYYMNLRERKNSWNTCYALKKKFLPTLNSSPRGTKGLSYARFNLDQISQDSGIPLISVDNSGWHFTHLGGVERLMLKFNSYSHSNDPWPSRMKDIDRLKSQITLGVAIWTGERLAEYVPIDDTFPKYIQDNEKIYEEKGYIRNIYTAFRELQKSYIDIKREFSFSILNRREESLFLDKLSSLQYIESSDIDDVNLKYINVPYRNKKNISEGRKATQSSVSEWSHSDNVEKEASSLVSGNPNGRYKIHTLWENNPWWRVDLGGICKIQNILIFNRVIPYSESREMEKRADSLIISVSDNDRDYKPIYEMAPGVLFGGIDGSPLSIDFPVPVYGKFLKIHLPGSGILHLDKVEIFGEE